MRDVVSTPGPYATAYLDVGRNRENAEHEIALRWHELRQSLVEQGAHNDALEALDASVAEVPAEGRGRCLAAAGGRMRLDRPMPEPPRRLTARWSPLPQVWPYLAQLPRPLPYVVAVVDRTGADLFAFELAPDGLLRTRDDQVVHGGEYPITKVATGGLAQPRYHQRAENLWEANARKVAAEADRLFDEVGAELLIAAGDPRARSALQAELSNRSRRSLAETEAGGRGLGTSDDTLADAIDGLVETRYSAQLSDTLTRFGNQDGGADGLPETLRALREGRVDTLLVRDDPDAEATLFIGPEPFQLAGTAEELTQLDVRQPERDRVDSALVRAAAAGDAQLVILAADRRQPGTEAGPGPDAPDLPLADGVGFIARY